MDFLREIVGGPKNRYKEFGYNLDLTYITRRVIAMAFPASGIEKLYRNSVDSIKELLENAHQNKYITINISGRNIEEEKLQNVTSYDWQDHKAPPFDTLFIICQKVADFLISDIDRISVFHCNHGKGRTGTIICSFFLFLGVFKQTEEVMKFYALRRFASEGYGVTQPCQIQYIEYFNKMLQNPTLRPHILSISQVKFVGQFAFDVPYIKVFRMSGKELVYNSKQVGDKFYQTENGMSLAIKETIPLVGDILIELKENKTLGKNLIISYTFNTAFVPSDTQLSIPLRDLSPLGCQKSTHFGPSFRMLLSLQAVCECGSIKGGGSCGLCGGVMKEENEKWSRIQRILKNREIYKAKGSQIAYGISSQ